MNIKCFHLVITQIRETSVGRRRKICFLIRFYFFFTMKIELFLLGGYYVNSARIKYYLVY